MPIPKCHKARYINQDDCFIIQGHEGGDGAAARGLVNIGFLSADLKKCKRKNTLAHILTKDASGINFLNYETTDFDAGTFVSRVHRVSPE